jgi:integrase/recombinase XerD
MRTVANFSGLVQAFFTDRLLRQRRASPNTVAGYRDTFRLLLGFAKERLRKPPAKLSLEDRDVAVIGDFLDHLEKGRGNGARSRNTRLAAIHSFFQYVSFQEPAHAEQCRRVLAIPSKRYQRRQIEYLTAQEIDALLAAPDRTTWIGRRDRAMLLVAIQTGLRVSELIGLRREDIVLGTGAHVHCEGKGRKQRCTPLRQEAVEVMAQGLRECPSESATPAFPSSRGGPRSRDAVERLVSRYQRTAERHCPSLERKKVTPHVLRHTAAMQLLQHGVARSVIALWLGHESGETTQMYLHADLRLKEDALGKVTPLGVQPGRFRPDDDLLAFLDGL